jgi:ABC-type transporter Mla MlaB component
MKKQHVEPVLKRMHKEEYSDLIMGTMLQETLCGILSDSKRESSTGILQIKPETMKYLSKLFGFEEKKLVDRNFSVEVATYLYMSKLKYVPKKVEELAYLYKKHYNTYLGSAKTEDFIWKYKKYLTRSGSSNK